MKKLLLLLLLLGLSVPAWSETIIDGALGNTGWVIASYQSVVASWALSSNTANVSIAVPLWSSGLGLSETGTAYLASSAPDFRTLSTQYAFPVIPPNGPPETQFIGLFDNLTLSPGTYYLTLTSPVQDMAVAWINFPPSGTIQTAPGVDVKSTYLGVSFDGPYLGQSSSQSRFRDAAGDSRVGLRITGDPLGDFGGDPVITAAPEPPTYALMAGLALLGFTALHFKPSVLRF
jgi:hypothetical protein